FGAWDLELPLQAVRRKYCCNQRSAGPSPSFSEENIMENKNKQSGNKVWGSALAILLSSTFAATTYSQRINQEGRILGPAPVVTTPTLFNTPAGDAIVSAMQVMPRDSSWNENISQRPLLSNSDGMIAQIISDLASNRRTLRPFYEMNYVLVPDNQPRITIPFFNYPDESDLDGGVFPNGNYPIPPNLPIETWPRGTGNLTLEQW